MRCHFKYFMIFFQKGILTKHFKCLFSKVLRIKKNTKNMNMSPTNLMRYVNKKNATKITIFIILILVCISFLLVNFCCQSKFTQRKNLNNIILNKRIIIFTIENRVLSLLLEI